MVSRRAPRPQKPMQPHKTLLPEGGSIDLNGQNLIVEKRINSGATGEVYRGRLAHPEEGSLLVAIKAMKALDYVGAREKFKGEAVTLAEMAAYEAEINKHTLVDLRIT